ncbi:hypothetical protein L915_01664 [Phytophthora nicotianae]|nr:hypothetical protein L915_01664 [Phytophthora nicotianae]
MNCSWPRCVLLNCPNPGELEFNRRHLCLPHFEQLSRPSVTPSPPPPSPAPTARCKCAFPRCKKQGVSPHNNELFCHRHLQSVLLLDAHVEGKPQPVRYRYTKKRDVRLCQVGLCHKNRSYPHGEILVCRVHLVQLEAKERYVDPAKAAEYAFDPSRDQIASRTTVCNYVDCNNSHVTNKYHGAFCAEHLPVIDDLRNRIMMAKCLGNEAVQIPLRYEEIFLRKFLDERHVQYYNELVAKHGYGAPVVHVQGNQAVGLSSGV